MNRVILILIPFLFFNHVNAQESVISAGHEVTFKLKITDLAITDSVGIGWFIEPWVEDKSVGNWSLFSKSSNLDGLYQQAISFPDSLMGKTISYLYATTQGQSDFERSFVLEKNKIQERIESWGFVDGLKGKIKGTKMLFVELNSVEEKTMFTEPYIGITTDGKPEEDLYSIKKTGSSTTSIKKAVIAFLTSLT